MIKKILIGGAITLVGSFLGALVEEMSHQWNDMVEEHNQLVDDYNDLLRKDQQLIDFMDKHVFNEEPAAQDVFESPNENWKDYKPSVSMIQKQRSLESNVDISKHSEKIDNGKDTLIVKTDKVSGFKIVSVKPKKRKAAE